MSEPFNRLRRFTEIRSANYRSRPGVIETVHEYVGPDAVAHDLTEHDLEQVVAEHSALAAEVERLRAEREALAALADELQDAELCDKVARSEWLHDRISRHETLGPAGRLADERLNETQARLCAAQDAWAAAAMQCRTARAAAAPQQPERDSIRETSRYSPIVGHDGVHGTQPRREQPERGADVDGAR